MFKRGCYFVGIFNNAAVYQSRHGKFCSSAVFVIPAGKNLGGIELYCFYFAVIILIGGKSFNAFYFLACLVVFCVSEVNLYSALFKTAVVKNLNFYMVFS